MEKQEKQQDKASPVEAVVMWLFSIDKNFGNLYLVFCILVALSVPIFSDESIRPFFQLLLMVSFILCGISGKRTFNT